MTTENTSAEVREARILALAFALDVLKQQWSAPDKTDMVMAVALGAAGNGDVFADCLWAIGLYGHGLPVDAVAGAITKTKEIV
jgi:hypothetical protein